MNEATRKLLERYTPRDEPLISRVPEPTRWERFTIWGKTHRQQRIAEEARDARWFAWYPVQLRTGRWAWLRRVSRKFYIDWGGGWYEYDLVKTQGRET